MNNEIQIQNRAKPLKPIYKPNLVNYMNKYIFSIGGTYSLFVSVYAIKEDSWQIAPRLNTRNQKTNSYIVDSTIYTYGSSGVIESLNANEAVQ